MNEAAYCGQLGAVQIESEKPVILLDDYDGNWQEFNTVKEAVDAREQESQLNQWAALKMIFLFDSGKNEFRIQTAESIQEAISSKVQT